MQGTWTRLTYLTPFAGMRREHGLDGGGGPRDPRSGSLPRATDSSRGTAPRPRRGVSADPGEHRLARAGQQLPQPRHATDPAPTVAGAGQGPLARPRARAA